MSHLGQVERWIKSALEANAVIQSKANGVHNTLVVQGNPAPYVVVLRENQPQVSKTLCGKVESIRALYSVNATGKDCGFVRLEDVEDAIEEAIPVGRVLASGKRPRFQVTLVSPVRRARPVDGGGEIYEAGGIYQFFITPDSA